VRVLEERCGHLMADADRREQRARAIAESCPEHGKEIQYLRHLASWCWAAMNQQESARRAIAAAAGNVLLALRDHGTAVPADTLAAWLTRVITAQGKVLRRPAGYPTLAGCLRGGGCDHDGLSAQLAAEIAAALGLYRAAGRGSSPRSRGGRARPARRPAGLRHQTEVAGPGGPPAPAGGDTAAAVSR
jgi:hypothetical protein